MGGLFEGWHPIVLLVIVLIVFGPGKIGNVLGELGKGVREFKDASEGKTTTDPK